MTSPDVAALLAQLDAALTSATQPEKEVEAPSVPIEQALRFELCHQSFVVVARAVRAIARLGQVARVPGVGRHIAGVTMLRGSVLPLIDLATMMGLTAEQPPQQLVVLADGQYEAGLLVHRVDNLTLLPPPLPLLDSRPLSWRPLLHGEIDAQTEMLLVINPAGLLTHAAEAL